MTKVKTSELSGAALDWAVAKCEGGWILEVPSFIPHHSLGRMNYSTDWAQGGPILERAGIGATVIEPKGPEWLAANHKGTYCEYGPTLLIAACRCYVASKLGDEVDVPEELA